MAKDERELYVSIFSIYAKFINLTCKLNCNIV